MKTFKQYCESVGAGVLTEEQVMLFTKDPYRFEVLNSLHRIRMQRKYEGGKQFMASFIKVAKNNKQYTIDYIEYPAISAQNHNTSSIDAYKKSALNFIIYVLLRPNEGLGFGFHRLNYNPSYTPNTDLEYYFKVFNIYVDTPGSEIEKMLAVAQFMGMERSEILKFKLKYGLLKSNEINDQDILDLF